MIASLHRDVEAQSDSGAKALSEQHTQKETTRRPTDFAASVFSRFSLPTQMFGTMPSPGVSAAIDRAAVSSHTTCIATSSAEADSEHSSQCETKRVCLLAGVCRH
jgi:hypothetical protein